MSTVTSSTDILIHVIQTSIASFSIGPSSYYNSHPHPGTNKKIEGWKWDQRIWPDKAQLLGKDFAPNIFDASVATIATTDFQSGIGGGEDLNLEDIELIKEDNVYNWTPQINHGHFYSYDKEWYLFSDSHIAQIFANDLVYSGLQYLDLAKSPKAGVPIKVRQFVYDSYKREYFVNTELRKRTKFTGQISDGVELDTSEAEGVFHLSNIDSGLSEFYVHYEHGDTPRTYLNSTYTEEVGQELDLAAVVQSDLEGLELLGQSDGNKRLYHTRYSPIDPSGVFNLYTYTNSGDVSLWSKIENSGLFTSGSEKEYKLDYHLGLISFGNYDSSELTGSGMIPSIGHKIIANYTKSFALEYEPVNTRDLILAKDADVNPLHNRDSKGFVQVNNRKKIGASILLSADLDQDSSSTYYVTSIGNLNSKLIATVTSPDGEIVENQKVYFELIDPAAGNFTTGLTEATSFTNSLGKATAFYSPPRTTENLGFATRQIEYSGVNTILTFSGLLPPETLSGVYLYKILSNDPALGIDEADLVDYYQQFLNEHEIYEDPASGVAATTDFEADRRLTNSLLAPTTYKTGDITTGAKVAVLKQYSDALDPKSGIFSPDVYAPIIPSEVENIGTSTNPISKITYEDTLDSFDSTFKSYFAVTAAKQRVRAYVYDEEENRKIFSNSINIELQIPEEANGTFIANALSDIPATLLKRFKLISELTDSEVLTFSGDLYDIYTEDRWKHDNSKQFYSDADTLALYHFDSNLEDSGPEGNDGTYSGTGTLKFADAQINSGIYLESDDYVLFPVASDWDHQKGSIEFNWKSLGGASLSTGTHTLVDFLYSGTNTDLLWRQTLFINSDSLTFRTVASGVNVNFTSSLPSWSGLGLEDDQFHHFKMSWSWSGDDSGFSNDGYIVQNLYVDSGLVFSQENEPCYNLLSGDLVSSDFNYLFLGFSSGISAPGLYDELRFSNSLRHPDMESFIEWFRRTRRGDSDTIGLHDVTNSETPPFRIPLGFRLKSPGVTVASLLDQITFVNPNPLIDSGYFNGEPY